MSCKCVCIKLILKTTLVHGECSTHTHTHVRCTMFHKLETLAFRVYICTCVDYKCNIQQAEGLAGHVRAILLLIVVRFKRVTVKFFYAARCLK